MISMNEILKGKKLEDLPEDHQANLKILLERVNRLRSLYNRPMKVSSGYRSLEDHLRIYADKGIRDLKQIPMKSRHLIGAACDFADPDRKLNDFVRSLTSEQLEELELWFEDDTPNWLHCQIAPPKSGRRFFKP